MTEKLFFGDLVKVYKVDVTLAHGMEHPADVANNPIVFTHEEIAELYRKAM